MGICDDEFQEIRNAITISEIYINKYADAHFDEYNEKTTEEWKEKWMPIFIEKMKEAEAQIVASRSNYDRCILMRRDDL